MTDIHTRLADALHDIIDAYTDGNITVREGVDVLLRMPGIAITEAPICTCPASTLFSGSVGGNCPEHGAEEIA